MTPAVDDPSRRRGKSMARRLVTAMHACPSRGSLLGRWLRGVTVEPDLVVLSQQTSPRICPGGEASDGTGGSSPRRDLGVADGTRLPRGGSRPRFRFRAAPTELNRLPVGGPFRRCRGSGRNSVIQPAERPPKSRLRKRSRDGWVDAQRGP